MLMEKSSCMSDVNISDLLINGGELTTCVHISSN